MALSRRSDWTQFGARMVELDLAALAYLLSAQARELIEQGITQAHQIAGGRLILPND